MSGSSPAQRAGRRAVYRHPLLVRLWHWFNALCLALLLMSGLQILNAHPALYWGEKSTFAQPWLALASGDESPFPDWIIVPGEQDLAGGRHWHFFFAWLFVVSGAAYCVYLLASGRLAGRLWPTGEELRHIGRSALEHLRLRFPRGEEAARYNVLQKLSYLVVLFGLLPLMVLTGLTMSPAMDARFHLLPILFGGRQSARSVHFLTAAALVAFFLIHMIAVLAAAGAAALGGCDRIADSPRANRILGFEERWNRTAQRWLLGRDALAAEYPASAISRDFRSNGSSTPGTDEYNRSAAGGFADWRLTVGGLVERPLTLSVAEVRALPSRTQITRHDCVEGWSCIAKWRGARLAALLDRAGLKRRARFLAFFCADTLEITLDGTGQYYETIDLVDAYHPQTILAYEMNDQPLPVPYGAPLRLRVERQLGYKMAKYVMRIEALESFAHISRGKGGFWEDRGYAWYAGI